MEEAPEGVVDVGCGHHGHGGTLEVVVVCR